MNGSSCIPIKFLYSKTGSSLDLALDLAGVGKGVGHSLPLLLDHQPENMHIFMYKCISSFEKYMYPFILKITFINLLIYTHVFQVTLVMSNSL